jgi:ectoine hydroxylase-related dioxygenase (phytanoyl-CoA dioxygenase family)
MWCITEFTSGNGALRVIPGSHRTNRDPVDDMEFPGMGPHPDEVKLIAPAGSLILFNSASLWHSGTLNYSPGLRLAVTAYLNAPAKAQPGAASVEPADVKQARREATADCSASSLAMWPKHVSSAM